jgi:hypothetical protein
MLTEQDKGTILADFPNIKLSYEKIIHKKVYPLENDYLLAIPEGKKCFAWFTIFNDKSVCFIFELDNKNNKKIKNIKIINCCHNDTLSYGTIVYGTVFHHLNNKFFTIEDIYFYKGQDVSNLNFVNKLHKIITILKNDMKQISYNNHFVVFGLPVISQCYEDLDKKLQCIKYKINCIYYIKNNSKLLLPFNDYNKPFEIIEDTKNFKEVTKEETKEVINKWKGEPKKIERNNIRQGKIFLCKPDIQNDIYHLYSSDNNNEYVGLACIPDYKTSVMMNKLFRIIKENDDLDALEESDDEEEFETADIDKFVYLDKCFKFLCNYNNKFKKWVPIKILE